MINLLRDDKQILDEEQAIMDDHKDKVAEIIQHMQELQPETKAELSVAHSTGHSHHLHRELNDVESNLRLVKEEVDLA